MKRRRRNSVTKTARRAGQMRPFSPDQIAMLETLLRQDGSATALRDLALLRVGVDSMIDLPNPQERLYPGMYAEVSLEIDRRPDALTLPATAVGSDDDGNFVDTIADNRITRRAINLGLTDNGRVEVTAGLSKDTPVVAAIKSAPPPGTAVQPPMVRENS